MGRCESPAGRMRRCEVVGKSTHCIGRAVFLGYKDLLRFGRGSPTRVFSARLFVGWEEGKGRAITMATKTLPIVCCKGFLYLPPPPSRALIRNALSGRSRKRGESRKWVHALTPPPRHPSSPPRFGVAASSY